MATPKIPDMVRHNPWLSSLSIGAIIAIVGALFAIDGRYVHAGDFTEFKTIQQMQSQHTDLVIKYTADMARKQILMDKLEDIENVAPASRTQNQNSKLERLKLEINSIDIKWPAKDIPK